jgi:hypothetical protein
MQTAYITIHRGKNPPPQNGSWLKSVFLIKSTGFTSSTFPTQPDFSQNQPDFITLNICSSRTLIIIIVRISSRIINYNKSNVRGEPVFSALAAGWFCEKSS